MQPTSFLQAFCAMLRTIVPYWLIALVAHLLVGAFDSPLLDLLLSLSIIYLCLGAWLIFARLKETPIQSYGIGLEAAARNLYRAAWWPWYVLPKIRNNGPH
jgi:hypothetical protein